MTLYWVLMASILSIVVAVICCEIYKIRFECSQEAKDERGTMILLKQKSLSYNILFLGISSAFLIIIGFEGFGLKWLEREVFIYWIMFTGFLQSIASTIYTHYLRKDIFS
ncbi:hypothetical protein EGK58_007135 [Acinetobacter variabilis]|nr:MULTISPECIES: hypothetical protein [Acinetobacter]QXR20626.1 hypothetical protein EGK58_007135 [Acinetobacter variabilis]